MTEEDKSPSSPCVARYLHTLEQLLQAPPTDLSLMLTYAADLVAEAVRADKVDAFLYQAPRDSLVAVGKSTQPLSRLQQRSGLDVLPISNGGRAVFVYKNAQTFSSGELERDPHEVLGVKEVLRVRSIVGVPLQVGGTVRGVLMIASQ